MNLSGAARGIAGPCGRSPNGSGDTSQTLLMTDVAQTSPPPDTTLSPVGPITATAQATPVGNSTFRPDTPAPTSNGVAAATSVDTSLFSDFRSYATASNEKSTAAYQEYVKAWGGRVVHGEVEFPPLSIYLE